MRFYDLFLKALLWLVFLDLQEDFEIEVLDQVPLYLVISIII